MRKLTQVGFAAAMLALGVSCGDMFDKETVKTNSSSLKGADLGGYSCEQQAAWGKCGEGWMHPTCDYACGGGSPSIGGHSCEQQAAWGKCGEGWMHPTCDYVCGSVRASVSIGGHSCEQQAAWGKCGEWWMHPVCDHVCGSSGGAGQILYYYQLPNGQVVPVYAAPNGGYYPGRYPEDRQYTTGGLLYPDLGAHNGRGGGWGGGYTTGGLLYPDLGAHNGGGYYGY